MEILQFIFSGFWTWLGTLVLLVAPISALAGVIRAWRCRDGDDL